MLEPRHIEALAHTPMPYGKYQGRALIDLPEPYLVWLVRNALPEGELGQLLELALDMHREGLVSVVRGLRKESASRFVR